MIVCDSHKFIFCRNMRTGSTSIKKRLELLGMTHISLNCNARHYGSHMPMAEIRRHITEEQYQNYFKFSIVRNPWDRLASAYVYKRLGEATKGNYDVAPLEPYHKWLDEILPEFPDYIKLLKEYPQYHPAHKRLLSRITGLFRKPPPPKGLDPLTMSQYDFAKGVDFIGKYESLQEGFAHVANVTKIPYERLRQLNRSFKPNYRSMYDEESKAIVARYCAKDIKAFDYKF